MPPASRPDLQHLARTLTRLRQHHNPPLSQAASAQKIGISERQLSRLENAQDEPHPTTLAKIATAYQIPADTLQDPHRRPADDTLKRLETKIDLLLQHFNLNPT